MNIRKKNIKKATIKNNLNKLTSEKFEAEFYKSGLEINDFGQPNEILDYAFYLILKNIVSNQKIVLRNLQWLLITGEENNDFSINDNSSFGLSYIKLLQFSIFYLKEELEEKNQIKKYEDIINTYNILSKNDYNSITLEEHLNNQKIILDILLLSEPNVYNVEVYNAILKNIDKLSINYYYQFNDSFTEDNKKTISEHLYILYKLSYQHSEYIIENSSFHHFKLVCFSIENNIEYSWEFCIFSLMKNLSLSNSYCNKLINYVKENFLKYDSIEYHTYYRKLYKCWGAIFSFLGENILIEDIDLDLDIDLGLEIDKTTNLYDRI